MKKDYKDCTKKNARIKKKAYCDHNAILITTDFIFLH